MSPDWLKNIFPDKSGKIRIFEFLKEKREMKSLRYMPVILAAVCGCGSPSGSTAGEAAGGQQPAAVAAEAKVAGVFSADSAMEYLRRQIEAGPRVPGSPAHRATGEYLASELRRLGADTVIEQHVEVTAWNGDRLPLRNIMAR